MGIKICLDAGHYGKYNRSPVVPEYYESDMNWKLHLLLKAELEKHGIEVITTREDQAKDMGLTDRGKASKGCNLFISLHSNAAERENADYPVVYHPISGACSDLALRIAKFVEETMETVEHGRAQSRKSEKGNWDYYGVIYGAVSVDVPGLIVEHSFHTNTRSTQWLLDDSNLEKLAVGEADIIATYFGLQKPAEKPTEEPERLYRIRERWDNPKSQTAAYKNLDNAIKACPIGYTVYDWIGKAVYTNVPKPATLTVELPTLRKGDNSETVRAMQSLLMLRGIELPRYGADGDYGAETMEGVIRYQNKIGRPENGECDLEIWKQLLGVKT